MSDDLRYQALIVAAHENDRVRRPAGGGKPHEFTNPELAQKEVLQACENIKTRLQENNTFALASLKLHAAALAKSHRPQEAFTQDTCPIIGDLDEPGEFLVLVSPPALDQLSKRIHSLGGKGAAHLTSVKSFDLLSVDRCFSLRAQEAVRYALDTHKHARLKLRLLNGQLFTMLDQENLEQRLHQFGVEEMPYIQQGNFLIYAVTITNMDVAMELAKVPGVARLEPMPTYVPAGTHTLDIASLRVNVTTGIEYLPIIGIIDSGIDPNSPLAPLVYARKKYVLDAYYNPLHGTGVAALATAQDGIVGNTLTPRCRLLDVTLFPDRDRARGTDGEIPEDALLAGIRETVEEFHEEVKDWNLSFARKPGIQPTEFSDIAAEFDEIQRVFGVQFFCSPGNCDFPHMRRWPPDANTVREEYVAAPGDSLYAITVGSCAPPHAPADAWVPDGAPSPFSPRGPVAYGVLKPDLLDEGGNIRGTGTKIGVHTIGLDGEPYRDVGTSFSTPRVCGMFAELATYIENSGIDSSKARLCAKALLLHHAQVPDQFSLPGNFRIADFYGFGRPASLEEMLGDPFWRSTSLLYAQLLPDGNDLVIDDFPYPEGLRVGERFLGHCWLTMVSQPLVKKDHKVEYARSNVELHFGTVSQRDNGKERWESPLQRVSREGYEEQRIREQYKWSPTKQYRTPARIDCRGDRWRLRVEMMLRNEEARMAMEEPLMQEQLAVDVVIAITILDPDRVVQVSNQMVKQWVTRGYVPTQIAVAPRLRTRFAQSSSGF